MSSTPVNILPSTENFVHRLELFFTLYMTIINIYYYKLTFILSSTLLLFKIF